MGYVQTVRFCNCTDTTSDPCNVCHKPKEGESLTRSSGVQVINHPFEPHAPYSDFCRVCDRRRGNIIHNGFDAVINLFYLGRRKVVVKEIDQDKQDNVNHPRHYNAHPSGVECITITEHMNFNIGNAIKYLWRADHKNGLEDLKKAAWYVNREIERQERGQ